MENIFSYHPDPEARQKRQLQVARELLEWGRDGKYHQPVLKYCDGQLNKFYLYLTFDCPLHCPFCFADGGVRKSRELSADEFFRLVSEAVEAGYRSVVITGGEPLWYREIDSFLQKCEGLKHTQTRFILRTSLGFPVKQERLEMAC